MSPGEPVRQNGIMTRNEIQITLPEAAAGCLHKLYADELRQSLRPPVDPMVNAKQTRAMIRRARDGGPGLCEEPDPTTWIWSDLHLGHEDSLLTFDRPFRTPDDMDQAMRDAWYELVGVDDTIICLGDVGPDSSIRIDHQAWWREAPGAKWLVLGNHDVDRYQQPYDPDCPVVCMDEQPVQLVQETRPPVAATATRPRRVDYEYERAGTASVFLFSEPLAGWRQATARARRTKADWAVEVAGLLEGRYADCPRVTLVCDNLNTHTKGRLLRSVRAGAGTRTGSSPRGSATRRNTGVG